MFEFITVTLFVAFLVAVFICVLNPNIHFRGRLHWAVWTYRIEEAKIIDGFTKQPTGSSEPKTKYHTRTCKHCPVRYVQLMNGASWYRTI
ncbi:MAG: hypothetical protein WCV85_04270 [Patescibacteria group bacterium]|jgi:hypothetical protein